MVACDDVERLRTVVSARTLIDDLGDRVPALMEAASVPGLSLTLIRDAQVFWSQAFGVRSRATQEPVTRDTVFEAASLSKPVFAYACLKLCEAGVLELDAPLAGYLPEPYLPDEPRLGFITIRHVLSHTSGFPNWRPKGQPLRLHLDPGERYSYSGEGYVYLQAVVEHVTGQTAEEYVWANTLKPLGMENSRFVWTGREGLPVAVGHDEGGNPKEKALWPKMNGAASLHCTATDYARFMCAVMRPYAGNAAHLGPEMTAEMLTPQVQVNDSAPWQEDWPKTKIVTNDSVSWGLGWGIQRIRLGDSFWHWGDNVCYRAFAVGYPEGRHGLVVLTNGQGGHRVIERVLREVVGGDYPGLDWLEETEAG